jgi:hypothetical protein
MKPWSSAVLFAVGWYLLMPPFVGGKPDIEAPLSRWDQAATFTSLNDCSDERDRQLKNVAQEAQRIDKEQEQSSDFSEGDQFSLVEQTVAASKCVSSEEPGLQATKLRPAEAHHSPLSRRHGRKPRHTNRVNKSR